MNDTLELEPIETSAGGQVSSASTEVATAAAGSVDLMSIDLEDAALAKFGDWQGEVESATKKLTGLVLDMSNQSKLTEAKSLRQRLINAPIANARKTSTALKSKLTSVGKAVGAREVEIVAAWGKVDTLITPQIDKREKELADEKAFRDGITTAIKACHGVEADKIRAWIDRAEGLPSEKITKGIDHIEALVFGPELGAFLPLYQGAKSDTLVGLRKHLVKALADEAAEAQRVENERVAADLKHQADELERDRIAFMTLRVAAAVFTFPEPEPEPEPVAAPVPPPVAEAIRTPQPAGEPPVPMPPAPAPAAPARTSLVATNNAAREAIAQECAAPAAPEVVAAPPSPPPAQAAEEAAPVLINTTTLGERLGVPVNADLITSLGFTKVPQKKPGTYWLESDFEPIGRALIAHIEARLAAHASA